ncbi:MAG: hypothetical protein J1F69_01965 [Clostridiales bacterium]|nr:hypothetical protein [Clostridiales bacterium]
MLVACDPDIKYDDAISIAKKKFGVEKLLWIGSPAVPSKEMPQKIGAWHYYYYVIGEKDGKEIYIVIPSPQTEEAFVTTWSLDYTFKQIVEEFNKLGAGYVIDVPDDYYSKGHDSYIDIVVNENYINRLAEFYEVDEPETFYERLDVKAVFGYRRVDDEYIHDYMVAQIDGKLVSYEQTQPK